jgi:hypothetical protein
MKGGEADKRAKRTFPQNLSGTLEDHKDVVSLIVLPGYNHVTGSEPRAAALSLEIGQPVSGQIAKQLAARKVQRPLGNILRGCTAAVHPTDKLSCYAPFRTDFQRGTAYKFTRLL